MNGLPGALTREAFAVLASTAGPIIGVLLLVGLVVGVFQAATHIQDPAVGFLPRLAVALLACWALGAWVLERYSQFLRQAFERMS